MKSLGNYAVNLLMLVFFGTMFYFSLGWSAKARFFPQLIAIAGLVFSISLAVIEIVKLKSSVQAPKRTTGKEAKVEAHAGSAPVMFMWLAALFAVNLILGFWVGCILFMLAFMRFFGHESWKTMTGVTAAIMIALYLSLSVILKIPVYGGLMNLTPY